MVCDLICSLELLDVDVRIKNVFALFNKVMMHS